MRWLQITEAKIDSEIRKALEQYGAETVRILLLVPNSLLQREKGIPLRVDDARPSILQWLKEKADEQERRETWLFAMEVAITVLVGLDLFVSLCRFFHR